METMVIVGGTSGMGRATAQLAADRGYRVILTGRDEKKVQEAAGGLSGPNGVVGQVMDFTNQASVEAAFGAVGGFDHLVLVGSGAPARGPVRDLDAERFSLALQEKLLGYHRCLRAALGRVRADGSVTVVTGGASRAAIPGTAVVASVNAALQAWALVLAKELAPLRVNVLSPGFVDTPLHDWLPASEKQALFERLAMGIPVGRVGRPEEVADAVLFLAENRYASGVVLDLDGGGRLR